MQHFQSILFILGILAIVAVLVHGYIVSRKESLSAKRKFDKDEEPSCQKINEDYQSDDVEDFPDIKDYDESVSENCDFSLSIHEDVVEDIDFVVEQADAEVNNLSESAGRRQEAESGISENTRNSNPHEDFFVFNVVAREGASVRGNELLQFFLTSGFRYGDMSIFHRHENSDGTGPVLFSIANMLKPGTLDPDNMEQFTSEGLSFFLTAPNTQINIRQAFDMMVLAVEQMAEEFDCEVLNGNREPFTQELYREYHERLLRYI